MTTIISVVIGFPVTYYISKLPPRGKSILLALAIFPLLTSSVVRSLSWMIALGQNRLINNALMSIVLIQELLSILYTPTSRIIDLVHLFCH